MFYLLQGYIVILVTINLKHNLKTAVWFVKSETKTRMLDHFVKLHEHVSY